MTQEVLTEWFRERRPRPLNRKNAEAFADDLYREENGTVHYRPLCSGELAQMNGEVTCCVIGEMYEHFTGKPLYLHTKKVQYRNGEEHVRVRYHPASLMDELQIVKQLVQQAKLLPQADKEDLWTAMFHLAKVNDADKGREETEEVLVQRAQRCAEKIKWIAKEYLR